MVGARSTRSRLNVGTATESTEVVVSAAGAAMTPRAAMTVKKTTKIEGIVLDSLGAEMNSLDESNWRLKDDDVDVDVGGVQRMARSFITTS
jgi:hypothetical protein